MSDHWEYYPCAMGDNTAFIVYDHGVRDDLDPLPTTRLGVRLTLKKPNEQGLPTNDESPSLQRVENAVEQLAKNHGGQYVGRVTVAGARHYVCYVDVEEEATRAFLKNLTAETGYELAFFHEEDPERKGYWDELFPSAHDWRVILDLRVIDALEKHGDLGTKERKIDHWAYFPSVAEADSFVRWAQSSGYSVVERVAPEQDGQTHGVHLFHVGRPAIAAVSHHTIALLDAAAEHGGEYDGWETTIEKE